MRTVLYLGHLKNYHLVSNFRETREIQIYGFAVTKKKGALLNANDVIGIVLYMCYFISSSGQNFEVDTIL